MKETGNKCVRAERPCPCLDQIVISPEMMKYLKLTFDIQRCCGRFAARGGLHRAAVLALVPRPGVSDGQHGPPGANFNIIYKQKKKVGENSQMLSFIYL